MEVVQSVVSGLVGAKVWSVTPALGLLGSLPAVHPSTSKTAPTQSVVLSLPPPTPLLQGLRAVLDVVGIGALLCWLSPFLGAVLGCALPLLGLLVAHMNKGIKVGRAAW